MVSAVAKSEMSYKSQAKADPIPTRVYLQRVQVSINPEKYIYLLPNSMRKRKASNLLEPDTCHNLNAGRREISSRHAKEKLVNEANSLEVATFRTRYINQDLLSYPIEDKDDARVFQIDFKSASRVTAHELNACFNLIETTSRPDYEASSWGWYPKRKKREMKEDEMRYLLVRQVPQHDHPERRADNPVLGFLSFMLTHDSTPSEPVLYVYENHLPSSLRKLGLGAHLMNVVEGIAENVEVDKVMLTCFLSNKKAHSFYTRRGYMTDACSPDDRGTRTKTIKVDYVIMSKTVPKKRFASDKG